MPSLQSNLISPDSLKMSSSAYCMQLGRLAKKKSAIQVWIDLDFCPVKLNLAVTANILKDD
jgi:hypothetical protein